MSSPPSPVPVPGSGEALRARYGARYRWLLLATVMVGVMASIMSSTVFFFDDTATTELYTLALHGALPV